MKRRGNIMIMTLIACALLALVLVVGLTGISVMTATSHNRMAILQLEQLHRTAIQDSLARANQTGEVLTTGRVILSDTPLDGQERLVEVTKVKDKLVTVCSESRLADGGYRRHKVLWLRLPREDRMDFTRAHCALHHKGGVADVENRWLAMHCKDDCVLLSWQPKFTIGNGAVLEKSMQGSMYVTNGNEMEWSAIVATEMNIAGNAVFTGNCELRRDLSCKNAWIDGTLTIGGSVKLRANTVYLGEDISVEALKKIEAKTIYMPHPPTKEKGLPTILPLKEMASQQATKYRYFMLQQID